MPTLDKFTDANEITGRALRGLKNLDVSAKTLSAFNLAEHLLAEVGHFATCWEQVRTAEDKGELSRLAADEQRAALQSRIVAFCVPDRF